MAAQVLLADDERQRLVDQYAEIAALAGGLAHEIRNPLSTISLNLELLEEDVAGGDSARERRMLRKLQILQRECAHLETILEEFLRFARVGELELVESDLNELVQEFIDFYRAEADAGGIEISPHLDADLPRVRLDRTLFRQAISNLARNAQQAMPKGGLLELQTSVRDGWVELALIDNGVGMNEQTLAGLFNMFFSTKPGGTGLGLPTVKRIVVAHGGRVTVDSAPGRGTRFTIALPPVPANSFANR
ncbi:MAG: two-component sensor histidine kinase [Planctomycetaceae bacterium]|nr:MAG: two-component sensor histidine kinase [Planctomycetaceae bacterium]